MTTELDDMIAGIGGSRVAWADLPRSVRADVEVRAGARVVHSESQHGGFSPALASRLRLDGDRTVFVKAFGPGAPNAEGREMYRREARVAALLPRGVPAPRLLDSWEVEGWVVLLFEDVVAGRTPSLPWVTGELERVLDAVDELGQMLTPAPMPTRPIAETLFGGENWRDLAGDPNGLLDLHDLDPWVPDHLDEMAELERGWVEAAAGHTLLHCDLRADNILLTPERVVFVDWPHVSTGAAWVDLVYFLPSVTMQGGSDPDVIFWARRSADGADPDRVRPVVAAFAGFMFKGATLEPPPGLPRLPAFQRAQGEVALRWLKGIWE